MIDIIYFILFLIYTISIFFVKNYYVIGIITVLNIMLMIFFKVNFKNAIIVILKFLPFIFFTSIINIIISGLEYGMLIAIRLILVCNMTYIFSKKMTPNKLQYVMETILKPLKIFKIDSKEIGIIVCIGIAFIPIIQKEIQELKYALKAKGFNPKFVNILRKPTYILTPLLASIFKRVNEVEYSLVSKGYAG